MMQDRSSSSSGETQAGFTLLEVLLAVGLSTLLMAALYTSMSVYWTTALESYDEIERGQIARAILREIARDVQSCTFSVEKRSQTKDGVSSTVELEPDVPVSAETAIGSYTSGMFGQANDLTLFVSRPDSDQDYVSSAALTSPQDRSSDSMIIRYLLSEEGQPGLPGQFAEINGGAGDDSIKGLARMSGDLAGLGNAMRVGNVDMQLAATKLLAAEVADIQFRFFDGVVESEEWDSTTGEAMPLAVIVELTLRSLPNSNDDRNQEELPGYLKPTIHKLVIPVPVAEPYVESDTL